MTDWDPSPIAEECLDAMREHRGRIEEAVLTAKGCTDEHIQLLCSCAMFLLGQFAYESAKLRECPFPELEGGPDA